MITPTPNDVGRYVVWTHSACAEPETGIITSVRPDGYSVFVRLKLGRPPEQAPCWQLEWLDVDKPREARIIDDILRAE